MIAERAQQNYSNPKYYQFYTVATILEHVIDCLHTMVSAENNPYHPQLAWLTRKQLRHHDEELFLELIEECSTPVKKSEDSTESNLSLSQSLRCRLDKCTPKQRKAIVTKTKDGCSPLFMACEAGHTNIVRYLLDNCEADIEQMGRYEALEDNRIHSVTPLWMAAVSANISVARLLIEKGANVNSLSDTGSTPLRSACFLCRDDEFSTQSHEAVKNASDTYMEIVKLLVESGADLSTSNHNGGTCLINSIHNYALTQYLVNQGCNVNAADHRSKTALHYAIQKGRLDVTKLLISSGANPMLKANFCDDALQLCCIGGHVDIFDYLIDTIEYPKERLIDAYKLLGSSILELHYDLTKTRQLWLKALLIERHEQDSHESSKEPARTTGECSIGQPCDIRRSKAYCDYAEFTSEHELQMLTTDEFRIQSLLISDRVLGQNYREKIQRLLYRGTFYFNSLRPERCIDLWIYALKLRLEHESILHLESILAAQAIMKLFLDLFCQDYPVQYEDLHDVLALLIGQLDECKKHLNTRPVYSLHEDILDLLLGIIMNLLYALNCIDNEATHQTKSTNKLIEQLVAKDPRTSDGSSLLHICIADLIVSDVHKMLSQKRNDMSPIVKLIDLFLESGLQVDSTNREGLSPLQVLCLTSTREADKRKIVKQLVKRGAHVDRRPSTPEQGELIRQSLRDAGVNLLDHVTLSCLAARQMARSNIKFDSKILAKGLRESIAIH